MICKLTSLAVQEEWDYPQKLIIQRTFVILLLSAYLASGVLDQF